MENLMQFLVETFELSSIEEAESLDLLQSEKLEKEAFQGYLETLERILEGQGKEQLEKANVFMELVPLLVKSSLDVKRKALVTTLTIDFGMQLLDSAL